MTTLGFISLGIILVGMLYKHQIRKEEALFEFPFSEEPDLWKVINQDHPSLTKHEKEQIFLDCLYHSTDDVDRDIQSMISSMHQPND